MYKLICLFILTSTCSQVNAETAINDLAQYQSIHTILDQTTAPTYSFKNADKDCSKKCSQSLILGKQTFRFNHKATLNLTARYEHETWVIIKVPNKKETVYHLLTSKSSRHIVLDDYCANATAEDISISGELVCLYDKHLVVISTKNKKSYPLPHALEIGVLGHNINGRMDIAYIDDDKYSLHVNSLQNVKKNQKSWQTSATRIHSRSDFSHVIAISPVRKNETVVALYEYINIYNKGLNIFYFKGGAFNNRGRFIDNENENFGFSPEVTAINDQVTISAENSSQHKVHSYQFTTSEISQLKETVQEFSSASQFEFMFGVGIQQAKWQVTQKIEVDDVKYAKTSYDMNDSLLRKYFMQGRWGNTQLAVNYLTNKAEDVQKEQSGTVLEKYATDKLLAQLDFGQFFSGASTLRLVYETVDAGGIANYSADDDNKESYQFSTTMDSYSLLLITERGIYYGAKYSIFDAPSAVGYLDSNQNFVGSAFDLKFDITHYTGVIGYDEAAYGARYETDYNRFYFSGELGAGLARLGASKESLFEAVGSNEGYIQGENALTLNAELEMGYTIQHRSKIMRGLGYSFQLGYRAKVSYINQEWDERDNHTGADDWLLVYQRTDVLHGPFAEVNVIF